MSFAASAKNGPAHMATSVAGATVNLQHTDAKRDQVRTGILGYDNLLDEFTGAWCDNSNTGLATYKGSFDQKQNKLIFKIEQTDLQTATRRSATATYTFNSDSTIDYTVTTTDSKGVKFSPNEFQYRKQKGL